MLNNLKTNSSPSRRDVLKASFTSPTPHIASLMVQARPEHIPTLTPVLNSISGVEVHASADNGRMVVTVEADNDQHLLDLISAVETREHVIIASLVYHQIED
jgi:nitrate reductase NapD